MSQGPLSLDQRVLTHTKDWLEQAADVWLATVVKTYGSSPRPQGSLLAWSPQFGLVGSLSGGCVEEDLLAQLATEPPQQTPCLLKYGVTDDERARYQLPCGGHLEVLLERLTPAQYLEHISQMLDLLNQRRKFVRQVSFNGRLSIDDQPANGVDNTLSDTHWTQLFRPEFQLLIAGAGEVAHCLAELAQPAGFAVTVCDFRETFLQGFAVNGVDVLETYPDELVSARFSDDHSAVVALAHDPRVDDMAIIEALSTHAFYVGAMGSIATSTKRLARLTELGVATDKLQRLHAPIGIDIHSKTPYHIAVSILAHLLQHRPID